MVTPLDELREEVIQTRRALEAKLLTPDPRFVERSKEFLAGEGSRGVARVLRQDRVFYGRGEAQWRGVRFAGFSFTHRANAGYGSCELAHWPGTLRPDAYWGGNSLILAAGLRDLDGLGQEPPAELGEEVKAVWSGIWERSVDPKLFAEDFVKQAPLDGVGSAYLIRVAAGKHGNLLAAIRVIDADDDGFTFQWRILADWTKLDLRVPVPRDLRIFDEATRPQGDLGESLMELSVDGLRDHWGDLDLQAERLLTSVPEDRVLAYRKGLKGRGRGVTARGAVRLLNGGRSDPLIGFDDRYAGVSFATERHSHRKPHLSTGRGRLIAGSDRAPRGVLVDLGRLEAAELAEVVEGRIPELPDGRPRPLEVLLDLEPMDESLGNQARDGWMATTLEGLAGTGVKADQRTQVGHTYVLRMLLPDRPCELVVFTVLEEDKRGCVLAWDTL